VTAGRAALRDAGLAAGIRDLPDGEIRALADRMAGALIARVDLGNTAIIKDLLLLRYDGPDESVFSAYMGVVHDAREATTRVMRRLEAEGKDPLRYFNERPYVIEGNARLATPIAIRKPVDLIDLVIQAYMTEIYSSPLATIEALQVVEADVDMPRQTFIRLFAGLMGNLRANAKPLYWGDDRLRNELLAMIKRSGNPGSP
jgi:hypothetical protein